MIWYYITRGGHTHVRVYLNGALCGHVTFLKEEFWMLVKISDMAQYRPHPLITFIEEP